ncbi:Cytochrome P450 84A1 [Rhynchospora pubera]|uniref:Cytochrome P450 84A1 n=1 Tax=Rhynchospora pubera TaxID=906938 RepID=A0AAV8GJ50_9POAL|nr:Cytochrome P450 84A1 [Rhynchospora pubera]
MEWLQLQDPVFLPIICISLFIIFKLSKDRRHAPFPPGPPQLPILGNMLMMGELTHRGLAALAERYGGLLHLRLGFLHAFAVSTPEMARQVLQVQDNVFSNRPATIAIAYLSYNRADMAFAHYGPFWRQMRKLCVMKLFSRKRAESWASVRDEVDLMIRSVANSTSGAAVNLGELIFTLTMNITFRAAFGAKGNDDQEEFISILQEFSKLFGAFNIGDFIPSLGWMDLQGINKRLKAARASLDRFIDKIIDEHIENPKSSDDVDADMVDDMLAFLAESKDAKGGEDGDDLQNSLRLTRDNIKAIIMDVMFGGTETVASAIEWAMSELMKSPDNMRQLQAELASTIGLDRKVQDTDLDKLPFLKCVVKETLRLHPPIPLLLHETAEDCVVAGYSVPKRSRVMINVFAIGRDKSAWKDADTFHPSRFNDTGDSAGKDFKGSHFEFLPFGSGRRSCPGMQLGLYGLELAVAQLVHCFDWNLPDGMKPSELDMSDVFGLTAPRAVRLSAVPTPRLSCPLY